jgi:hypothetical protein
MTIQQISIFLENKYGKLNELLALPAQENIRIVAGMVADTSEFGILRMIVSHPQQAYALFKKHNVGATLTDVLAIVTAPSPDGFTGVLGLFTEAGLSIEYMYCFSSGEKSVLFLRTNNPDSAMEVVRRHGLRCLSEEELPNL